MHIYIKTPEEIEIMKEGGAKLRRVKNALKEAVKVGVNAMEIEDLANELIEKEGAESAFKKVEGYSWSTCINRNEGVVHGIPKKEMVFVDGDVVSVDVGLYYKGFYTDTSFSKLLGNDSEMAKMLQIGQETLNKAIKKAVVGNKVRDISHEIEYNLKTNGYNPIESLVGHGVGRELHEDPMVPCFVSGSHYENVVLKEGLVLAIEIMYTQGKPGIKLDQDGWTLSTKDGKMSALFEETVAIGKNGPVIIT